MFILISRVVAVVVLPVSLTPREEDVLLAPPTRCGLQYVGVRQVTHCGHEHRAAHSLG